VCIISVMGFSSFFFPLCFAALNWQYLILPRPLVNTEEVSLLLTGTCFKKGKSHGNFLCKGEGSLH
jgi:hypothetical protein